MQEARNTRNAVHSSDLPENNDEEKLFQIKFAKLNSDDWIGHTKYAMKLDTCQSHLSCDVKVYDFVWCALNM